MKTAKKRILFVDDEPAFLNGLKRMLRGQRAVWEMAFAESTDQALEETRKRCFDAIICDVKMPGADGFDLLTELRQAEATKEVPIVILSAVQDRELKSLALNLGATDVLSKPVSREDLLARLRGALRLKAYQDELRSLNENLERIVAERTRELEESRLDIVWRLAKAAEHHDEETGNHVVRVACNCRALAQQLGLAQDAVEMIFITSPLHDIGKIGIPDRILLRQGRLTPEERAVMQQHCAIGAEILRQEPKSMSVFMAWRGIQRPSHPRPADNRFLEMASSIALTHHERWDGKGYPSGLAGEGIPLESRLVALADVHDALGSARPYRPAYPEHEALAILREEKGRHFDPEVFAAFEKCIDEFRSIRAQFSDEPDTGPGAEA